MHTRVDEPRLENFSICRSFLFSVFLTVIPFFQPYRAVSRYLGIRFRNNFMSREYERENSATFFLCQGAFLSANTSLLSYRHTPESCGTHPSQLRFTLGSSHPALKAHPCTLVYPESHCVLNCCAAVSAMPAWGHGIDSDSPRTHAPEVLA